MSKMFSSYPSGVFVNLVVALTCSIHLLLRLITTHTNVNMRSTQCLKRISKSLGKTQRSFSERPTLPPSPPRLNSPLSSSTESTPKSFPSKDSDLFSEHPFIFDTHKMVCYLKAHGFSPKQSESLTNAIVRVSQHANRHHATQMVTKNEFVSLRSELSILEKADFALLKTDINAIEKRMETSVAELYTAVERVENRVIKWVIAVAGAIGLAVIRLTSTGGGGGGGGGGRGMVGPPPASNVNGSKKGLQILVT